jgi:SAM-dependent methyltransferase
MDARDWDQRYAETELMWSATPNRFVEGSLSELRPGRALDLACGEGRNAIWLAERGWVVTALDFSQVALDKGRTLVTRHPRGRDLKVEWVHGDALTHPLGREAYDLVVVAYLQLPVEQRHTAVRRAFDSLAPGGIFFLVAHDSLNLTHGTGGPQDPEVLYTAEDVLADLDGERFEVVRAEAVERPVPAEDGSTRTAVDALVHLVRIQ